MNFKNAVRIGYTVLIAGILTLPAVLLPAMNKEQENTENRSLADFPSARTEEGKLNTSFFEQVEAWFTDHFALRSELVTAYGSLSKTVFATSAEDSVIIGKDGWLYYAETVPSATGVRSISDAEIKKIVHTLEMANSYCELNGAKLIFACAPNKSSVYPDYLPARYLKTGSSNDLDALHAALSDTAVTVCDLRSVLRQAAKESGLQQYHKLDTHWNGDGAMTAYQALMQTARLDDYGYSACERTETQDFSGDLWNMLFPSQDNPDRNAQYGIPETHKMLGRYRGTDDITIRSECENGEGTLLMFRDSFGRALIPILSERFFSCTYSRQSAVPLDNISASQTDIVIWEIVERNLANLLCNAPRFPAPEYSSGFVIQNCESAALTMQAQPQGYYYHICGLYDIAYSDNSGVYCTVSGADGQPHTFEAFPCCETDLLGLEQHSANGFSLYLPVDALREDTEVQISVQQGSNYYCMGTKKLAEITVSE